MAFLGLASLLLLLLGTSSAREEVTTMTTEMVSASEMAEVFEPAKSAPSRSEAAAVQPVSGIGQRLKTRSGEKKDLGTLGFVLGVVMVVILIAIGAGIVVGYVYKRARDLRDERQRKIAEREAQRVTLPLSAFANPACEMADESDAIVTHTNRTPVEDPRENGGGDGGGGAPLMTEAGTPGA